MHLWRQTNKIETNIQSMKAKWTTRKLKENGGNFALKYAHADMGRNAAQIALF